MTKSDLRVISKALRLARADRLDLARCCCEGDPEKVNALKQVAEIDRVILKVGMALSNDREQEEPNP